MILDDKENTGSGLFGVNMTPLIDVSLVLVVILLLLTPLAYESGIWLSRSQEDQEVEPATTRPELLDLAVVSEDTVRIDAQPVFRDDLTRVLQPLLRNGDFAGVTIHCAGNVTHGAFVNVLDQAKQSGAATIAVAGS